jgi:hypothetical protein
MNKTNTRRNSCNNRVHSFSILLASMVIVLSLIISIYSGMIIVNTNEVSAKSPSDSTSSTGTASIYGRVIASSDAELTSEAYLASTPFV